MKVLHAIVLPGIEFKDASLAVQSEKASTLIYNILHKFQATGDPALLFVHDPSTAVDPQQYPSDFTEGANSFTERRERYVDEGIAMADGLERDLAAAVQPVSSGEGSGEGAGDGSGEGSDDSAGKIGE